MMTVMKSNIIRSKVKKKKKIKKLHPFSYLDQLIEKDGTRVKNFQETINSTYSIVTKVSSLVMVNDNN